METVETIETTETTETTETIEVIEISVPDLNDSFSSVVLCGVQYLIRFTWNEYAQRWSFGLYTSQKEPLAVGIRLVPRFPINIQLVNDRLPDGVFGVYSDQDTIGRRDFIDDKATFTFIPINMEGA